MAILLIEYGGQRFISTWEENGRIRIRNIPHVRYHDGQHVFMFLINGKRDLQTFSTFWNRHYDISSSMH